MEKPEDFINKESNDFEKNIELIYRSYDTDGNGTLDYGELRAFIDDMRKCLQLTKADDKIFRKIRKILDEDRDEDITIIEFMDNLNKILPIISECDDETENKIKKDFADYDVNSSGMLDRAEFKLMVNHYADKMGVERSEPWQIDYIMSLCDDNCDACIDVQEMVDNYCLIQKELMKNNPKNKKAQKKKEKQDQTMMNHIKIENTSEMDKANFLFQLEQNCKNLKREAIKKKMEMAGINNGDNNVALDIINDFSKSQSRDLIPLSKLIDNTQAKPNNEDSDENLRKSPRKTILRRRTTKCKYENEEDIELKTEVHKYASIDKTSPNSISKQIYSSMNRNSDEMQLDLLKNSNEIVYEYGSDERSRENMLNVMNEIKEDPQEYNEFPSTNYKASKFSRMTVEMPGSSDQEGDIKGTQALKPILSNVSKFNRSQSHPDEFNMSSDKTPLKKSDSMNEHRDFQDNKALGASKKSFILVDVKLGSSDKNKTAKSPEKTIKKPQTLSIKSARQSVKTVNRRCSSKEVDSPHQQIPGKKVAPEQLKKNETTVDISQDAIHQINRQTSHKKYYNLMGPKGMEVHKNMSKTHRGFNVPSYLSKKNAFCVKSARNNDTSKVDTQMQRCNTPDLENVIIF